MRWTLKSIRSAAASAFAALLVAIAPALSWAQAGNSIERVDATQTGNSVMLTIQMKQPVSGIPASFSVANPARIAIDLPQASNNLGRNLVDINQGDLRSVNVVQAQGRSRVVLNLRRAVTHAITVEGNTIQVALGTTGETTSFRAPEGSAAAVAPVAA